jgi:hypothetical protein
VTGRVFDVRVAACSRGCLASYRQDRMLGLMYGLVRVVKPNGTGKMMGWSEASLEAGFCCYCGAGVRVKMGSAHGA